MAERLIVMEYRSKQKPGFEKEKALRNLNRNNRNNSKPGSRPDHSPEELMMREWIWKALCEVVIRKAYSNLYLRDHLNELPAKDRGLATRIFYGTLQNYAYCQAAWKRFARGKVSAGASVLMTMSAYQLLFLDKVPAYAVINDAVKVAVHHFPALKGFVNAVLRKCADTPMELPEDDQERLALQTSLPLWLIRMWSAQYGSKQAEAFAKASLDILPDYVRINPMRITLQDLAARKDLVEDPSGLYLYQGEGLAGDPLYLQGKISAQDPGSFAIAEFVEPEAGEKILDLCAAPGTKTMAMAEIMDDEGEITACDIHPHRVGLIASDAKRLHLDCVKTRVQDSAAMTDDTLYDRVLCDVPCSGYGVLARKPDLKLKLDNREIDTLLPLQKQLLETGADHLKEGGTLVYSTCTLNKKENEKQVEAFLQTHPEFELDAEQTMFPDGLHDGFYMARLRKGHTDAS